MGDIIVKSGDSDAVLQQKAEGAVGGPVSITERTPGERVVHLSQDQTKALNRMTLPERRAALGGDVKQLLND